MAIINAPLKSQPMVGYTIIPLQKLRRSNKGMQPREKHTWMTMTHTKVQKAHQKKGQTQAEIF